MKAAAQALPKPPIVLSDVEADRLYDLALQWRRRHPFSARLLLDELERAQTMPASLLPRDVVTMGSHVTFLDRVRGDVHAVHLVYPGAADMTQQRVSVMTPIGAGLIGMRCGRPIDWPTRQGEWRRLEIVAVTKPAPRKRAA